MGTLQLFLTPEILKLKELGFPIKATKCEPVQETG